MPASKLAAFFIALLYLCKMTTSAQTSPGLFYKDAPAHLTIQQSGPHSVRIKLSNKTGDEKAAPDNPAFIAQHWGNPIPLAAGQVRVGGLVIKVSYRGGPG